MPVSEKDAEQVLGAVVSSRRAPKVQPVILRDTREQLPLDRFFSPAVRVEVATIGTGDYTLKKYSSQLAIERKNLQDLCGCCGHDRDRFMDQARRMTDYRVRMLVIEADEAEVVAGAYRSNIDYKSVIGAVRAIQMDYGVAAYWVHDQRGAAKLIEWVCLRMVRKSEIYQCEEPDAALRRTLHHRRRQAATQARGGKAEGGMSELYTVEQFDEYQPKSTNKEWWSKEARNINGIEAAVELARVLRELKGRPTRVLLQQPPAPSLPIRWERT